MRSIEADFAQPDTSGNTMQRQLYSVYQSIQAGEKRLVMRSDECGYLTYMLFDEFGSSQFAGGDDIVVDRIMITTLLENASLRAVVRLNENPIDSDTIDLTGEYNVQLTVDLKTIGGQIGVKVLDAKIGKSYVPGALIDYLISKMGSIGKLNFSDGYFLFEPMKIDAGDSYVTFRSFTVNNGRLVIGIEYEEK